MSWPALFFALEGFQWNNSPGAVTPMPTMSSAGISQQGLDTYQGTLDLSVCSRNHMSWWLSSSPKIYSRVVCWLELRSMLGEWSFKLVLTVDHVPTHRPFADSVLTSQDQSDIFPPDATLCSAQATEGTERWHHCSPWCFACLHPFHYRCACQQAARLGYSSIHENVGSWGHAFKILRITEGCRNLLNSVALLGLLLLLELLRFLSCASRADDSSLVTSSGAPRYHPQPHPGQVHCQLSLALWNSASPASLANL